MGRRNRSRHFLAQPRVDVNPGSCVLTHQICTCINTEYYPKLAELKKAPSARSSFRLIARANPDLVNRESARGGEARRMTRTVTTTLVTLCSVITILQAPRAWLLVSRPVTSRGRVGLASHSTFSTQLRHDFHDAPAPARPPVDPLPPPPLLGPRPRFPSSAVPLYIKPCPSCGKHPLGSECPAEPILFLSPSSNRALQLHARLRGDTDAETHAGHDAAHGLGEPR